MTRSTDTTTSPFRAGVCEAISTWTEALGHAYARRDDETVERALNHIALATRLGQRDLSRARDSDRAGAPAASA